MRPSDNNAGALSASKIQDLIACAKTASTRAYCPYSRFAVGAAVLTSRGGVYVGCNVENASYGLTMCAERTALFQAVSSGDVDIIAVAVYTPNASPALPCGACRQTLHEFAPQAEIFCACAGGDVVQSSLTNLLPRAFGPNNLISND